MSNTSESKLCKIDVFLLNFWIEYLPFALTLLLTLPPLSVSSLFFSNTKHGRRYVLRNTSNADKPLGIKMIFIKEYFSNTLPNNDHKDWGPILPLLYLSTKK